ncbi:hypothetical protein F4777DRAFT_424789 [Nemania sp. FL0916]|nr:hypothetical protein F4777DRAFT_424789 [Nemania sp. FL0916]
MQLHPIANQARESEREALPHHTTRSLFLAWLARPARSRIANNRILSLWPSPRSHPHPHLLFPILPRTGLSLVSPNSLSLAWHLRGVGKLACARSHGSLALQIHLHTRFGDCCNTARISYPTSGLLPFAETQDFPCHRMFYFAASLDRYKPPFTCMTNCSMTRAVFCCCSLTASIHGTSLLRSEQQTLLCPRLITNIVLRQIVCP